ncbi:LAME_0C08262g1_1 [Lachancea meyersii CBS 8951]|uniref:LAME_0C08262g1_1 n=1 Tax=Lachancea meyersii CBS 8951 TaxID=1266667 RepID=A0A1G4J361_9SACH|nr:LAME_0C08262g1_1 [Lachancea meyersii CBS 8951]
MTADSDSLVYTKQALEPCVFQELPLVKEPVLQKVLSAKLLANLDILRKSAVESRINGDDSHGKDMLSQFQNQFSGMSCTASMVQHASTLALDAQYTQHQEALKSSRLSVDFDKDATPEGPLPAALDQLESKIGPSGRNDENLTELRNRLLGKNGDKPGLVSESNSPMEKQMQVQNNIQEELISDMSQLVSGLKQGAEAFQAALNDDSTVLKATEIGLQATSRSLHDLGGKLKRYHNSKVGLLFYLTCILFMFVSLIITYLIIKIFPKM